jgi:hypothetical protein
MRRRNARLNLLNDLVSEREESGRASVKSPQQLPVVVIQGPLVCDLYGRRVLHKV